MKLLNGLIIVVSILYATNTYAMGYSKKYMNCMQSSNNQANITSICQVKELKYQEKRLKKLLKKNSALSNAEEKVNLNRIQNQWASQRELSCGMKNKRMKDLSSVNVGCALQLTSSRADMLEVQVTNKNLRR